MAGEFFDLSAMLKSALGNGAPVPRPKITPKLQTLLFIAEIEQMPTAQKQAGPSHPNGLTLGLRKDIFGAHVPEVEATAIRPFETVAGPMGPAIIRRVAMRMTPRGLEPVDLEALAKQRANDAPTLPMSGRLLFKGEDPGQALNRANRFGLVMAGIYGVEGCRLFRDNQNQVGFQPIEGVKGYSAKYFARYCQGMAGVAALLYDGKIMPDQPIKDTVLAKVILPNITDTAGLGHAINIDKSEPTQVGLGFTWMPEWKLIIDKPKDETSEDRTASLIHRGVQIYRGPLTVGMVKNRLIPVIQEEAQAFLGRDYQWDHNTELLWEIVHSTDSTAQWVNTHVPMQLPALPPLSLDV
jgi:hypothetical protein